MLLMAVYERRDLHGARPLPVPGGVPGPQLRGRHLLQPVPEQGQVHPGRRRVPTPPRITHTYQTESVVINYIYFDLFKNICNLVATTCTRVVSTRRPAAAGHVPVSPGLVRRHV